MNTRASVWYGWAFFTLCGAGSFYFAKRSIDKDRHERYAAAAELNRRRNAQIALGSRRGHAEEGSAGVGVGVGAGVGKVLEVGGEGGRGGDEQSGLVGRRDVDGGVDGDTIEGGNENGNGRRSMAGGEDGKVAEDRGSKFESRRPFKSKKGDRFS